MSFSGQESSSNRGKGKYLYKSSNEATDAALRHSSESNDSHRFIYQNIRFGLYKINTYPIDKKFRPKEGNILTTDQRTILDNLWNCNTKSHKLQCLNSLSYYFSEENKKKNQIVNINYQAFVVLIGHVIGIFKTLASAEHENQNHHNPLIYSFSTFQEAFAFAQKNLGPQFYIEPESYDQKPKPHKQTHNMPFTFSNYLEKKNFELEIQVRNLQKRLKLSQLSSKNSQTLTRANEALKVRLKLPILCLQTLQPLFDQAPDIRQILSEYCEQKFIQDQIYLQQILLQIHVGDSHFKGILVSQEIRLQLQEPNHINFAGLLKATIDLANTNASTSFVINLWEQGMIDELIITDIDQINDYPQEKFKKAARFFWENNHLSKLIAKFVSLPHQCYGLTEKPAESHILLTTRNEEIPVLDVPKFLKHIDNPEFYRWMRTEDFLRLKDVINGRELLAETRTYKIWGRKIYKEQLKTRNLEYSEYPSISRYKNMEEIFNMGSDDGIDDIEDYYADENLQNYLEGI